MKKIDIIQNKINVLIINDILTNSDIRKILNEDSLIITNTSSTKNFTVKELIKKEYINKFNLKEIEDCLYETLSKGQKVLIQILNLLEYDKLIVLNNILLYLDPYTKETLIKILKKEKKTILIITINPEDIMYSDNLFIYKDELIYRKINDTIKDEKLFKEIDSELPFMILLSQKLSYYNLVDKAYTNMTRLVNKLWK